MRTTKPSEPWLSFLNELDQIAGQYVLLPCLGGFAVSQYYGLFRPTKDLDVFETAPKGPADRVLFTGRVGGPLFRKYGVYIEPVGGIVELPYDYDLRLRPIFVGVFKYLDLQVFDPYDLALSKLRRSSPKDIDDVLYLARTTHFDLGVLRNRYMEELRPYVTGRVSESDWTLEMWIERIEAQKQSLT